MRQTLEGCRTQPLGSYLKALATLRLVASQCDPAARGWWGNGMFTLDSCLDEEGLIEFFMHSYRPTPLLAPWNGGSGFYPKDNQKGIGTISTTSQERFLPYAKAIAKAREIVAAAETFRRQEADDDERRGYILRQCRNQLDDACVEWLDATVAIAADGERSFAPILGTGGNEGRLDYTNNFMANLADLLLPASSRDADSLLRNALYGTSTSALKPIKTGQFDPGTAGGFNQGQDIESQTLGNPWSAILTMEGAATWAGGIYRKQGVRFSSILCSPFTVRPSPVGYGSAASADGIKARAELWVPIWARPARYEEIRALLREGRASVDGRPAYNGIDFARAAAGLGVDRGIRSFVRYSLLKRRGDSYVALPSGEVSVAYSEMESLVREGIELSTSIAKLAMQEENSANSSWPPLRRAIDDAAYRVLLDKQPQQLCGLAAALGDAMAWLLRHRDAERLTAWLSPGWVSQCELAMPIEVRIAAALSRIQDSSAGPMSANLTVPGPHFSWRGRTLTDRMLETLIQRTHDGATESANPFGSRGNYADPSDLQAFLLGETDDHLINRLLYAFGRLRREASVRPARDPGLAADTLPPAFCLLKQMARPERLKVGEDRKSVPFDTAIARLLAAGRPDEAIRIANRRLHVAGLRPLNVRLEFSGAPARLGAALLIPARSADCDRMLNVIVERPKGDQDA